MDVAEIKIGETYAATIRTRNGPIVGCVRVMGVRSLGESPFIDVARIPEGRRLTFKTADRLLKPMIAPKSDPMPPNYSREVLHSYGFRSGEVGDRGACEDCNKSVGGPMGWWRVSRGEETEHHVMCRKCACWYVDFYETFDPKEMEFVSEHQ